MRNHIRNVVCLIALVLSISSCEKETTFALGELPIQAQGFLSTYFPSVVFSHGEKDKDNGTVTYEVTLLNGVELEFNESGDWLSVDCEKSFTFVPDALMENEDELPAAISVYLAANHPNSKVEKIEKIMGGYEIDINAAAPKNELIFDAVGDFKRYKID